MSERVALITGGARGIGRGIALDLASRDVVSRAIAQEIVATGHPLLRPACILSGGETTVTLRGKGRGGRNVECLLSFTLATQGQPRIHALMGDTDGV